MQAGDAYSSWAPGLTTISGVRFFSDGGEGMAIFVLLLGGLFCYFRRRSAPVDSFQNLESSVRMSDLTKRTEPKSKRQLPDVKMEYEPDQKPSCFSNTQGGSSQPTDDTQMAYDDTLCKGVDTEDNIYEDLSDALPSRHKNITREMVKLDAMLHDGQFGIVFAGTLHKGNNVDLPVAIRCPKVTDTSGKIESSLPLHCMKERDLLQDSAVAPTAKHGNKTCLSVYLISETTVLEFEAKIKEVLSVASSIGRHDNLLRYIDAIVDGSDPPMLLMEHCHLGCVRTWLEEQQESLLRREDLISVLHNIGLGVALGMEYLEKKENFLKWTAPEVLQTQQSSISADVWAYGVILWELFQIDKLPYSDVTDEQYLEYLNDGNRMEIPDNCEERHANVMDQAWQLDPQDRPAFSEINPVPQGQMKTLYVSTKPLATDLPTLEQMYGNSTRVYKHCDNPIKERGVFELKNGKIVLLLLKLLLLAW
ncbi:hypothetical protein FSP39_012777 [Pinctada imbricata]|uniref:Protein kinase domain-containing protein n=1 Tax=Pinctada imbricata TaxID=66713 RepID=A0AA88YN10_PINIB|nr:hypothetical protein FSP39_012777 [Pinctada imbricata]